jgi:hypothetical protein
MQERQLSQGRELLEKFQATTTKVAVQQQPNAYYQPQYQMPGNGFSI